MSISLFLGEAVTSKRGRRGLLYQPLAAVGQVSDGLAGAKIKKFGVSQVYRVIDQ